MVLVYGYYNLFNVNATGSNIETVYRNALQYAMENGWNSRANAILGGTKFYKNQYVGKGQNTLYYQRFNVVYERGLFSHQYQQDVMGAETSARLLAKYYESAGTLNTVNHLFIIPLYENMPNEKCKRPNPNVENTVEFTEETVLTDKLAVRAGPNSDKIISYLNKNEKVNVLERAENVSEDGNYWDTIVSKIDGSYGYVLRSGISGTNIYPQYVFDAEYYVENYPDLKAVYGTDKTKLLQHFLEYGIKEGRKSSAVFDVKYYLEANQDVRNAFGNDYETAFKHFVKDGYKEFRKSSEEYDGRFYGCYYPDLNALSSENLLKHYIKYGKAEGRWAGIDYKTEEILFDANIYSECNNDLKQAYGNDGDKLIRHWYKYGIAEGRVASIAYNPELYKLLNPDLEIAFGNDNTKILKHFINNGIYEGRMTSLVFSPIDYLENNPDIKSTYGTNYKEAYLHFQRFGINEGRVASKVFEILTYFDINQDVKSAYGTNYKAGYIHFYNFGLNERKTDK